MHLTSTAPFCYCFHYNVTRIDRTISMSRSFALALLFALVQAAQLLEVSTASGAEGGHKWVQLISWKPRSFVFHNFLTDAEAAHIKHVAAPFMKRSTVAAEDSLGHQVGVVDNYRTSFGTFIHRRHDHVIEDVIARVAEWAKLPAVHSEDMQVLRYGVGQEYKKHQDSGENEVKEDFGPRVCTVLLYLNDVEEGGETAFPDTDAQHWADVSMGQALDPSFSPCAKGSVAFKPKKGDVLMFWSFKPDSTSMDHLAMHTGCPPVKGVKWTATLWFHSRPFRPETLHDRDSDDRSDPGFCADLDPLCEDWASSGECEKNAAFMVGDFESLGRCPKACGQCMACARAADDVQCYNDNRRKAGFLVYSEEDEIEMGLLMGSASSKQCKNENQQAVQQEVTTGCTPNKAHLDFLY